MYDLNPTLIHLVTSPARFTWESDSSEAGCGSEAVESVVVMMKMEMTMTMKMMEVIIGVVHFVQKWGDFHG